MTLATEITRPADHGFDNESALSERFGQIAPYVSASGLTMKQFTENLGRTSALELDDSTQLLFEKPYTTAVLSAKDQLDTLRRNELNPSLLLDTVRKFLNPHAYGLGLTRRLLQAHFNVEAHSIANALLAWATKQKIQLVRSELDALGLHKNVLEILCSEVKTYLSQISNEITSTLDAQNIHGVDAGYLRVVYGNRPDPLIPLENIRVLAGDVWIIEYTPSEDMGDPFSTSFVDHKVGKYILRQVIFMPSTPPPPWAHTRAYARAWWDKRAFLEGRFGSIGQSDGEQHAFSYAVGGFHPGKTFQAATIIEQAHMHVDTFDRLRQTCSSRDFSQNFASQLLNELTLTADQMMCGIKPIPALWLAYGGFEAIAKAATLLRAFVLYRQFHPGVAHTHQGDMSTQYDAIAQSALLDRMYEATRNMYPYRPVGVDKAR